MSDRRDRDEPLLSGDEEPVNRGFFSSKTNLIAAIVALLVIAAIIAGVAYYLLTDDADTPDNTLPTSQIDQYLMGNVSIPMISSHFHNLTSYSSLSGSPGSLEIATYVQNAFIAAGLMNVQVYKYTVLLNYPKMDGSGRLLQHMVFQPANSTNQTSLFQPINQSIKQNGTWVAAWNATLSEPIIDVDPVSNRTDAVPTFNAFSPSGDWYKSLFYASYCTVDEFELLKAYKFNMTDKIALCRYGDNFRGLKSMIGEKYGVTGVLIYSDPADDGADLGQAYPNGPFRPEGAVQRGSATYLSLFSGDVLSPGVARVYGEDPKLNFTQATTPVIPGTPVHPISWADASYLMQQLQGESCTSEIFPAVGDNGMSDWQGGMTDMNGKVIPYHIGLLRGDQPVDNSTMFAETVVHLELEFDWKNVTIYDVVGEITGKDFPEEHVILGNHRDAWVYGAVDPHQGTAVLLELARVYGELYKGGWRPSRTLKLASWDAEEWGLMGSTEYVEQFVADLQKNCVAYINVDVAATGHTISLAATHSLAEIARNVTKQVTDPWRLTYDSVTKTLADTWYESDHTLRVEPLGSGSDFTPFLQFAGIPAIAIEFTNATTTYGTYHSIYDSERYDNTQIDPLHLGKLATAQYWGVLGRQLVDAPLVPFNFNEYAHEISDAAQRVQNQPLTKTLNLTDYFGIMDKSTEDLISSAQGFMNLYNMVNASALSSDQLKTLNMYVYQFEQRFLTPEGFIFPLRDVDWYRHVIYAPSLFGGYSAVEFPGIVDAVLGDVGLYVNSSSTVAERTETANANIFQATQLISGAAFSLRNMTTWINITIFHGQA